MYQNFIHLLLLLSITWGSALSSAQESRAYIPSSDEDVLEVLPARLFNRDQMASVRKKLAADPNNEKLAATVARAYIAAGAKAGDPRFYGYARAAISPWWDSDLPPVAIAKVRAKLKEKDHDFDGAIIDIKKLLEREAEDVQAWIELANLQRVKGNYSESQKACATLSQFAEPLQSDICQIPLLAVCGQANEAENRLSALMEKAERELPGIVPWALVMQAEVSRVLGRFDESESHFKKAISRSPDDSYLKRAYAEFLIDRDKPAQALALLRADTSDTGILLIAAIAARKSGETSLSDGWQNELKQRFSEIRLRGGVPHGRFEAQYLLSLANEPAKSLEVALINWSKQKEARDSRNVLEAAIAAEDPSAARPVIDFLRENETEDIELLRLVKRLEASQ